MKNESNGFMQKASVAKPWMKFYPPEMQEYNAPEETLLEFILKNNTNHDQNVVEYYGKTFTLNQIIEETDKVAAALNAMGVEMGDRIVVFLRAVPEFIFVLLAAEKIGATIVCRDGEPEDHFEAIAKAKTKVVFAHDYITKADENLYYENETLKHIVLVSPYTYAVKEEIPDYIEESIKALYTEKTEWTEKTLGWNAFLESGEGCPVNAAFKNPDRALYCSYTSGSTGPSKQVIHTARTINGVLGQLVIPGGIGFSMRVLHTLLPPALVAIVNSILLFNIASTNLLILSTYCDEKDIDREFMRYRPNQMIAVPMMAEILMSSKRIPEDYPMNDLFVIGGGADPVHNKWLKRIQSFLAAHGSPAIFSMCYGLSEAGSTATNPHANISFLNCGGGIPMRGTTISVFEHGTTRELEYGEIGEVCVTSPGVMVGYATGIDNLEVMKKHDDGQIWVHTGDFGCMNEDGELFVYSRGLNHRYGGGILFTTVMENKLVETSGVDDCYFVIVPDKDHKGYFLPYLYIVPEEGHTVAELEPVVRAKLEDFEQPVEIFHSNRREYFHFKTNRRILAGKILNGEH